MRVLIIEDDPTARLMLKSILCKFADVTESTNGSEGMQAFYSALKDGSGFDLVCLDIGLPDVQGNDLLRLIREAEAEKLTKRSVVVVMTASHESEIIQEMLTLGADGYLVKPINRIKLIVRLRGLGLTVRAGIGATA
jgi:two-component system, chemotaxis family, chemotaxis protein CheY